MLYRAAVIHLVYEFQCIVSLVILDRKKDLHYVLSENFLLELVVLVRGDSVVGRARFGFIYK